MIENEEIFTEEQKKINDIIASGEIQPLEDLCQIEGLAMSIRDLKKKVDFYGAYKKKKMDQIEKEISSVKARMNFLKQLILITLEDKGMKNIKFPGACAVSSRKGTRKWVIEDEDEFIEIVRLEEKKGEAVDGVLEEVKKTNVVKDMADKLLDAWEKSGKLEELTSRMTKKDFQVVRKEEPTPSVVIKYEEEKPEESAPEASEEKITKKSDAISGYDQL